MIETKRIYISADLEGVAGVAAISHLIPGNHGHEAARRWMTDEVNAVCDAAFEWGVEEIVVSDSHGSGDNILIDELRGNVQIVRCWPRPLMMMQGVEVGHYDGAILLGYHTGSRDPKGTVAHTISGEIIELRINGEVLSETMLSALIAAQFGVPIIMASGDDAYTAHAREVLKGVETATVKWAYSSTSVRSMKPSDAQDLLRETTKRALGRVAEIAVRRNNPPFEVDLFSRDRLKIETLAYLPGIEAIDSHTVRIIASDMIEASSIIAALSRLQIPSPI